MTVSIALLTAGALVFVSAAVQHLNTVGSKGLDFVLADRSTPLSREGFAGRATRTVQNNLESAGMVLPAAAVLLVTGTSSAVISGAALIYAAVRVGYTLTYWTGFNKLRSFFWGIGMAMIAVLMVNAAMAVAMQGA